MTDVAGAGNGRRIAVIGLGSMGLGMAVSLARAGFAVGGCDRAPAALAAARQAGIAVANDPAEAAHDADAVVGVVVNAAQTEAVLFGPGGAVPAMRAGGIVISCATMAPADARRFAAAAAAQDALYLDAPMSGGSVRATEGALTFLVSGPAATYEAARPILDAMGQTVYHLGEDIGTGAAFKMVNQLLAGVHIAAACEALAFAKKLGLDLARVYQVISSAAGSSWMFENRGPHVIDGDYTPRSAVEIFVKDLGIVEDIARSERFPTPLAGAALQLFLMTAAAGMGPDDDASVARLYAKIAGITLPGPAAP
ncbi:MAG TPA: L-threonate dehydrogenase [Stellaceae bacterium]|jgi:3-hydroxyisobutyrate dehydrogenase